MLVLLILMACSGSRPCTVTNPSNYLPCEHSANKILMTGTKYGPFSHVAERRVLVGGGSSVSEVIQLVFFKSVFNMLWALPMTAKGVAVFSQIN